MQINNKICLFLDIDGVLNQYRISERVRRYKKHTKNNFSNETNEFNPYPKKVQRLTKLVKKYNIDVYIFSSWSQEKLKNYLPFEIKGDTGKYATSVENIMKNYKHSLLIDDELNGNIYGHERVPIPDNLITHQPNWNFGLVLKDFQKIEKILNKMLKC